VKEFSQPLLEQVKFDISNLTHEEYEIGKKLITDYNTIFSKDETDVGHTTLSSIRGSAYASFFVFWFNCL
jgi:hypothetical protein